MKACMRQMHTNTVHKEAGIIYEKDNKKGMSSCHKSSYIICIDLL